MAEETEVFRRGDHPPVKEFLVNFGCALVEPSDLERAIREEERRGKVAFAWLPKFLNEVSPRWINDNYTLTFEVKMANLTGEKCLGFTQAVWKLKPGVFEYQVWGGRGFVRMSWVARPLTRNGNPAATSGNAGETPIATEPE